MFECLVLGDADILGRFWNLKKKLLGGGWSLGLSFEVLQHSLFLLFVSQLQMQCDQLPPVACPGGPHGARVQNLPGVPLRLLSASWSSCISSKVPSLHSPSRK